MLDHLPTDGRDQSCAVCGAPSVAWVHPLSTDLIAYRQFDKGHTLPTFWCVCSDCEQLYERRNDEELANRHFRGWCSDTPRPASITAATWHHELAELPIAVWRRADLGARHLPAG